MIKLLGLLWFLAVPIPDLNVKLTCTAPSVTYCKFQCVYFREAKPHVVCDYQKRAACLRKCSGRKLFTTCSRRCDRKTKCSRMYQDLSYAVRPHLFCGGKDE